MFERYVVHLAFSVAVNLDPDILIIDEVLAVGDAAFRARCFDHILNLRRAGNTFICVSHSQDMLAGICDQVLWLAHGRAVLMGSLNEVFRAYDGEPYGDGLRARPRRRGSGSSGLAKAAIS